MIVDSGKNHDENKEIDYLKIGMLTISKCNPK